jgi:hypothetical protein
VSPQKPERHRHDMGTEDTRTSRRLNVQCTHELCGRYANLHGINKPTPFTILSLDPHLPCFSSQPPTAFAPDFLLITTAHLRHHPLRIPRKQTTHANIRQPEPKLHNALESKPASRMRRTSEPKAVHIVLGSRALRINRGIVLAHLRCEQRRVVNALGAGANLLAAHEHVVRVGEQRVGRRGHGVCGPNGEGELVERIEVRVVFLEHEAAEHFLLGSSKKVLDM